MSKTWIKNVNIIDGSGTPAFKGSVLFEGKKILSVMRDENAVVEDAEIIDGQGLTLAPGFIDAHTHADNVQLFGEPDRESKLQQGVTTEVGGNCGSSLFPLSAEEFNRDPKSCAAFVAAKPFETFESYKKTVDEMHPGTNIITFVGQKVLRFGACMMNRGPATPKELDYMKGRLKESMEEGALGMSTGLVYAPSCYAGDDEIVELLKVVARYGGIYSTHIRNEADRSVESLQEAINMAEKAGVALQVSHLKSMYPVNYHKLPQMLEMIDKAIDRGMDVYFDVYPYTGTSSSTTSSLPPSYLSMGADKLSEYLGTPEGVEKLREDMLIHPTEMWENPLKNIGGKGFLLTRSEYVPEASGKYLSEYAEMLGVDEVAALSDFLSRNHCLTADVRFSMNEENVEMAYKHDRALVGSDGIYMGHGIMSHPRAFHTFPRYLAHYIRERKLYTMEEGVRRMTGLTADRFNIENKGYIREGYDADLVLFNPETIQDTGTYENPFTKPEGIERVIVGGETRVLRKELVGAGNGIVMRRKGC